MNSHASPCVDGFRDLAVLHELVAIAHDRYHLGGVLTHGCDGRPRGAPPEVHERGPGRRGEPGREWPRSRYGLRRLSVGFEAIIVVLGHEGQRGSLAGMPMCSIACRKKRAIWMSRSTMTVNITGLGALSQEDPCRSMRDPLSISGAIKYGNPPGASVIYGP